MKFLLLIECEDKGFNLSIFKTKEKLVLTRTSIKRVGNLPVPKESTWKGCGRGSCLAPNGTKGRRSEGRKGV